MNTVKEMVLNALINVLGPDWVTDDLSIRQAYSKDASLASVWRKHAKDPKTVPDIVALPSSTEEVQAVLRTANRWGMKVVPVTTGSNMIGLCVPQHENCIVLDLKRMNRILDVDVTNMTATVQPYVSFARLQSETMKRGLWNGGTPLAPAVVGIVTNMMFNGIWQSCLAYGAGFRSLVNLKWVTPTGDVINTGSRALPGAGNFWWHGPGPDLMGAFQFTHYGALGVFTEATIKLHRWVGGDWPNEEKVYDHPQLPANHRIYFIDFQDFRQMNEAMYQISHAGIATHLETAMDAWNAFCSQPTQALSEKVFCEGVFPKHCIYVVIAGISSPRQIEYEEKVLRLIVARCGGRFRDDLRDVLATWHGDAFRSGDTVRVTRHGGYAITRMGVSVIDTQEEYYKVQREILAKFRHYKLDEEMPEMYICDRGYWVIHETDTYYDQGDKEQVKDSRGQAKAAFVDYQKRDGLGWYIFVEPLTTIHGPNIGPDFHLRLKDIKRVFDPKDTMNPGKLVNMG